MKWTIENWRTGKEITIKGQSMEIVDRVVYEFYGVVNEGKVLQCSYCIYNWDLINVDYDDT
jgi:hypothetical protein